MRSIKPVPLVLVIGALMLGAFIERHAAAADADRARASGLQISGAPVQQINELFRLFGIPVVLSTSAPIAQSSQHGAAVCFASEHDVLVITVSVGK